MSISSPTQPSPPADAPLSRHLRTIGRSAHATAAVGPGARRLLSDEVTLAELHHHLSQHLHLVSEVDRLARIVDPASEVGAFLDPLLERTDAVRDDLEAVTAADPELGGPAAPTSATATYVGHLRTLDTTDRSGRLAFLAHHYTRTLGDLAGGQLIGAHLDRCFEERLGAPLRTYRFDLGELDDYSSEYRRKLDQLDLADHEREHLTDEVLTSYRLAHDLMAAEAGS